MQNQLALFTATFSPAAFTELMQNTVTRQVPGKIYHWCCRAFKQWILPLSFSSFLHRFFFFFFCLPACLQPSLPSIFPSFSQFFFAFLRSFLPFTSPSLQSTSRSTFSLPFLDCDTGTFSPQGTYLHHRRRLHDSRLGPRPTRHVRRRASWTNRSPSVRLRRHASRRYHSSESNSRVLRHVGTNPRWRHSGRRSQAQHVLWDWCQRRWINFARRG